jgi:hypothetical protein
MPALTLPIKAPIAAPSKHFLTNAGNYLNILHIFANALQSAFNC